MTTTSRASSRPAVPTALSVGDEPYEAIRARQAMGEDSCQTLVQTGSDHRLLDHKLAKAGAAEAPGDEAVFGNDRGGAGAPEIEGDLTDDCTGADLSQVDAPFRPFDCYRRMTGLDEIDVVRGRPFVDQRGTGANFDAFEI